MMMMNKGHKHWVPMTTGHKFALPKLL